MFFGKLQHHSIGVAGLAALAASVALIAVASPAEVRADDRSIHDGRSAPKWLSGDFHQHTFYTDGSTTFDFAMERSNAFGLDWWANSEHGGSRNRNGEGLFWDTLVPPVTILGDVASSSGHRVMWRWQSLRDFVFPDIARNRGLYPEKRIFSGLEWNVPGHEHCSTAIVARDAGAISAFEYQFDASDNDTSRNGEVTPYGTLAKQNGSTYTLVDGQIIRAGKSFPERHADAVAACGWMQRQYDEGSIDNAWIVFAHIERDGVWTADEGGGYNVEHFRDLNSAGPDACYGFEGAPGHQVNRYRGFGNPVTCDEAGTCISKDFGGTYGGVGFYVAKVGGLWDALLGEGRRWFNFANSDYHRHYTAGGDDFYPGEYQRTWVFVKDAEDEHFRGRNHRGWKNPGNTSGFTLDEIADAMRSGNSWSVQGDLIDFLEFGAQSHSQKVVMGGELHAAKPIHDLKLTIRFRSPSANNCAADGTFVTACTAPVVDHIDLIAGEITGKVAAGTDEYTKATNDSARVIASFNAKDWETDDDGYNVIVHHLKNVRKSMYFRLRGTNLPCGTTYETGPAAELPSADHCSPLPDALVTQYLGIDGAQEAWNDLWFYSNPIFVRVNR
jgi:hypothetical protein